MLSDITIKNLAIIDELGLVLAPGFNVLTGETGALGMLLPAELAAWVLAAALGLAIFAVADARHAHFRKPSLIALLVLELFLASAPLPINNPTSPEAYASMRPAMLEILRAQNAALPAARMLSLSTLTYDPGDLTEMRAMLAPDITAAALVDAITAAKSKELLSPNLPLAWHIPTLDGYDGGLLPTRAYAQFAALLAQAEQLEAHAAAALCRSHGAIP